MRVTERITGPVAGPVTVTEAQAHLGSDASDELLTPVLASAGSFAERFTGTAYVQQSWRLSMERWDAERIGDRVLLSPAPLQSVTQIGILSAAGTVDVFDSDKYLVRTGRAEVCLVDHENWPPVYPATSLLIIDFVSGFLTPVYAEGGVLSDPVEFTGDLPEDYKRLVLELTAYLWRFRGDGFSKALNEYQVEPDLQGLLGKFQMIRRATYV